MNDEFLRTLFTDDAPFAHVTDFSHDPGDIPADQHLIAWRGDWSSRYTCRPGTNQYFCISVFNPDEKGVARRRKALFLRTRVIVLDDVREKLSIDEAQKLPPPSYILETSPGSEQWGYILTEPCHDRHRVENLLDGLVANGLAPDGRDPGMKGVTRYVRLPDGVNNKASKMVDGKPWQCRLLVWEPSRKVTLEQLAEPFKVDLDAARREGRVDGASNVPDHPVLQVPDVIHIKDVRSDGRFDITCPWVDEHTGAIDNGTAIFTNDDGSLGFKCHHGNCESRSARDLVRYVETQVPGWGEQFASWRVTRVFKDVAAPVISPLTPATPAPVDTVSSAIADLARMDHGSRAQRDRASEILQILEALPSEMDRLHYHKAVCDAMNWTRSEFKQLLKSLRDEWSAAKTVTHDFFDDSIYVKELDRIYEVRTGQFLSTQAFQNTHCHRDPEALKTALMGRIRKVDKVDFAPGKALVFEEDGINYANLWTAIRVRLGKPGDATPWLNHFDVMGWGQHRKHLLQWMAFTLLHPEIKINHMIILGGYEGGGKDFILTPLVKATDGAYGKTIHGDMLGTTFNEYLYATKFLLVNEGDTADKDREDSIANSLKPLASAPPARLPINIKNTRSFDVRNIVNLAMTTNSLLPIKLKGVSRRIYACWSDLSIRDDSDNVTEEWQTYWDGMWQWMTNGGWEHCVWYLRNCVDLSDFKPSASPPMTDFQRDMQEASKSPGVQTVEAFIHHRVGAFGIDMVTAVDASNTMRAASASGNDVHLYTDPSTLTPARCARLLKDVGGHQLRARNGPLELRVWTLRNHSAYRQMDAEQVYAEYMHQKNVAQTGARRLQSV